MHLRTMISSSSVRVKNLSSIVQGCRSCCRDGAITYRRRLFPTSSSPSSLTTALFRLQYRTFQSTTGLLDQPSPIVWTTHRLSPEQILKVDKIFHKILWLDFMEAALLTECLNKMNGIQLTAQQRRQIENAVHQKELAEDGDSVETESAAPETPVETGPKLFDLKLASFDAKSKIKVIKEVRSILNLGLKEAKELVESAPVNLQKGVKEPDAEAFKAKLQEAGAQIELVPTS